MKVTATAADGTAQGEWFIAGEKTDPASIRVEGEQVRVTTVAQSTVRLTRSGADRLEGVLTSKDGSTFPITLTRVKNSIDPSALVGEWQGRWASRVDGNINGPFALSIERVEGSRVYGRGQSRVAPESKFVGTLEGNRLTFGTTELVIDGKEMKGFVRSAR